MPLIIVSHGEFRVANVARLWASFLEGPISGETDYKRMTRRFTGEIGLSRTLESLVTLLCRSGTRYREVLRKSFLLVVTQGST
jgi:hypothetical protein